MLTVGDRENPDVITLDCIQCVTMISKLLGFFPDWYDRLLVAKMSGYNMIHLTPTQTLGISNSSYCLKDQVTLNPDFTPPGYKEQFTFEHVKELVDKMAKEDGVLTIADVVWNHTSKDSPFLGEHPECGYNLENSPHLRPAWLLDRGLHYFSKEVAQGKWAARGLPANISSEGHLGVCVLLFFLILLFFV